MQPVKKTVQHLSICLTTTSLAMFTYEYGLAQCAGMWVVFRPSSYVLGPQARRQKA